MVKLLLGEPDPRLRGRKADPSHLTQFVLPEGSIARITPISRRMGFFMGHVMELFINGETARVSPGQTVLDILKQRNLTEQEVVVERNLVLLPKEAFATTLLESGDNLEILHFVGGG